MNRVKIWKEKKAGNSQKEPEAKRAQRGQQARKGRNIVCADASEVEMQAENMGRVQEERILGKSIMHRMHHQGVEESVNC